MPAWIQRSTLRSPCWRDTMCGRKRVRLRSSSRRSEEHTSELQSQSNLVCRLLLEKKKKYARLPRRMVSTKISPPSDVSTSHSSATCCLTKPLALEAKNCMSLVDVRQAHVCPLVAS